MLLAGYGQFPAPGLVRGMGGGRHGLRKYNIR
jgi:hypothetical protein